MGGLKREIGQGRGEGWGEEKGLGSTEGMLELARFESKKFVESRRWSRGREQGLVARTNTRERM